MYTCYYFIIILGAGPSKKEKRKKSDKEVAGPSKKRGKSEDRRETDKDAAGPSGISYPPNKIIPNPNSSSSDEYDCDLFRSIHRITGGDDEYFPCVDELPDGYSALYSDDDPAGFFRLVPTASDDDPVGEDTSGLPGPSAKDLVADAPADEEVVDSVDSVADAPDDEVVNSSADAPTDEEVVDSVADAPDDEMMDHSSKGKI